MKDVVDFLADLHAEGCEYCSYRSAIKSIHAQVEEVFIGQHPLVCRLMKGAFQAQLPLPCYVGTWDVATDPPKEA